MAAYTNWCTPTSMNRPNSGKGPMRYLTELFSNADQAVMQTDINAFLDSLVVDGNPWPHLVDIEYNVEGGTHYAMVVYLLTGS